MIRCSDANVRALRKRPSRWHRPHARRRSVTTPSHAVRGRVVGIADHADYLRELRLVADYLRRAASYVRTCASSRPRDSLTSVRTARSSDAMAQSTRGESARGRTAGPQPDQLGPETSARLRRTALEPARHRAGARRRWDPDLLQSVGVTTRSATSPPISKAPGTGADPLERPGSTRRPTRRRAPGRRAALPPIELRMRDRAGELALVRSDRDQSARRSRRATASSRTRATSPPAKPRTPSCSSAACAIRSTGIPNRLALMERLEVALSRRDPIARHRRRALLRPRRLQARQRQLRPRVRRPRARRGRAPAGAPAAQVRHGRAPRRRRVRHGVRRTARRRRSDAIASRIRDAIERPIVIDGARVPRHR